MVRGMVEGGYGGGGGTNLPYTIQTSVRFGDFAELNLDQLFQQNTFKYGIFSFFSLTGPRQN